MCVYDVFHVFEGSKFVGSHLNVESGPCFGVIVERSLAFHYTIVYIYNNIIVTTSGSTSSCLLSRVPTRSLTQNDPVPLTGTGSKYIGFSVLL